MEGETVTLHYVVIHRDNSEGQVHVESVPPDEILVARMTKTIQDPHFVCHRVRKTVTESCEQGFDIDLDEIRAGSTDKDTVSGERQARYRFDSSDDIAFWGNDSLYTDDESMQEFWVYESCIRTDYARTGLAQIRKVISVGKTILENEVVDTIQRYW